MHIIFVGVKKCIYEFCSVLPPFELARGAFFPSHGWQVDGWRVVGGGLSSSAQGSPPPQWTPGFQVCSLSSLLGFLKPAVTQLSCNSFNFLFSFINVLVYPNFPRSSNICYILIVIFCFASFSQSSLVHAYFSSKCLKYETKWLIWSACLILIMFASQLSAHGISRLVVYRWSGRFSSLSVSAASQTSPVVYVCLSWSIAALLLFHIIFVTAVLFHCIKSLTCLINDSVKENRK